MLDWLDQAYADATKERATAALPETAPARPRPVLPEPPPPRSAPALPSVQPPKPSAALGLPEFKPVTREPSALGAAGRAAAENVLPGLAGIAAAAPLATQGAAVGAVGGPVGAAVGAVVGGLAGYFLASTATAKLQDLGLDAVLTDEQKAQWEAQRARDTAERPGATFVGEMAPQLIAFKPSIKNLTRAAEFAKELGAAKDVAALVKAAPEKVQNLVNVAFGTGTSAALETFNQVRAGEFDPLRAAGAIVGGALLTESRGLKPNVRPALDNLKTGPVKAAEPAKPAVPLPAKFASTEEATAFGTSIRSDAKAVAELEARAAAVKTDGEAARAKAEAARDAGTPDPALDQAAVDISAQEQFANEALAAAKAPDPTKAAGSVSAERGLSPLTPDENVRTNVVDPATEVYRTQQLTDDARIQEADKRLAANPTGERDLFYSGRLRADNAVDVEIQKRILTEDGQRALAARSDPDIKRLTSAAIDMREQGSSISSAFRARRVPADPVEPLLDALFTPNKSTMDKLRGKRGAERDAILDDHVKQVNEILDDFRAKYGLDGTNLDAVRNNPDALAELLREVQIKNASLFDKFFEYWRNAILSAPSTQVANIVGNTANIGWNYTAQRWTEALLNAFVKNADAPTFGELKFLRTRLFKGFQQAGRNAVVSWSTEQPVSRGFKFEDSGAAIGGTAGRVTRIPQRLLVSADEMAKAAIMDWEIASQVYRDALKKGLKDEAAIGKLVDAELANPNSKYRANALDEAERLTFQTKPGAFASLILRARNLPGFAGGVMRFVFPFVSTPVNILKTGLRKSPLGLLRMLREAGAGNYKENTPAFIRDAAEQILAYGTGAALFAYLKDENGIPRITGSAPNSNSKNERGFAQQNYPPQSIRFGDKWYSYARIEPFATALTPTIDMINTLQNKQGEDWTSSASQLFASLKTAVRDKTFMQGLGTIIKAMEDEKRAGAVIENFAASWVPNFQRATLRALDDNIRDYRNQEKGTAALRKFGQNVLQKAAPSQSLGIPVKRDYWGREVPNNISPLGASSDVLWRLVSPIRVQTTTSTTNIDRMVFNYNRSAEEPWYPGTPTRFPAIRARGAERDMTQPERDRYLQRRGEIALSLAQRAKWNFDNPTERDIRRLQNVFEAAGRLARREIIQGLSRLTPT